MLERMKMRQGQAAASLKPKGTIVPARPSAHLLACTAGLAGVHTAAVHPAAAGFGQQVVSYGLLAGVPDSGGTVAATMVRCQRWRQGPPVGSSGVRGCRARTVVDIAFSRF